MDAKAVLEDLGQRTTRLMSTQETFWQDRSVFITGCTGLLGSWLTEELVSRGAQVVGLVRDWVPRSRLLTSNAFERMISVRGAVEDYELLERVLNEYEVETVFHLAAQTIVGTANRGPLSTFEANIKGTWNILEACRRSPWVKRVVVTSSDKAYGDQTDLPYSEDMPLEGQHPYDVSKSCADLLAQSFAKSYKVPVAVARCANFFGGGDLNFNRVIPGTILSVLQGRSPIIRSDGTYVRDYLYAADGALACMLLAESVDKTEVPGRAYNFSYGVKLTVLEIVQLVLRLMGREDLRPVILDEVTNEIREQWLSSDRARKELGWSPRFELEASLNETIAWYGQYVKDHATAAPG